MSDPETTTTTTAPLDQEVQNSIPMETKSQNDTAQDPKKLTNFSLRIWPPTQRTRDAVISRLIETLSEPSVLSKRYGTMPSDEATAAANAIEKEAFVAAGDAASAEDDGIEILQVYSKEISKRMLESIKAKANNTNTNTNANSSASNVSNVSNVTAANADDSVDPAKTASEEVSSDLTEA